MLIKREKSCLPRKYSHVPSLLSLPDPASLGCRRPGRAVSLRGSSPPPAYFTCSNVRVNAPLSVCPTLALSYGNV